MSFLDDIFEGNKNDVSSLAIIDFSNILYSSYYAQVEFDKTLNNTNEKYAMWRYLILLQIINIKKAIQPDEIVLAVDAPSWRKKRFRYYKANRTLAKEKNKSFNYEEFYATGDQFIQEISENFPYKVIKVDGAEADDVIGVLVNKLSKTIDSLTIISRDKDFKQLLKYKNVKFYDPIDKKFKTIDDPYQFLTDHILTGDSSDGIPNLLSDDNVFVNSDKRQKRVTKKVRAEVAELGIEEYAIRNNLSENYERNKMLIELSEEIIPKDIQVEILYQYDNLKPKAEFIKIVQFLRKHKIKSLVDKVDQFI